MLSKYITINKDIIKIGGSKLTKELEEILINKVLLYSRAISDTK